MAGADGWTDVGAAAELAATPLRRIAVGNSEIALSFRAGSFGAVANACNHAGGPLGEAVSTAITSSARGITGSSTA